MNSVSWFLYAANTMENVGVTLVAGGLIGLVVVAILSGMYAAEHEGPPPWWRRYVAICLACISAAMFIPDKKTVWMIAASEMGERVAKTESATEISQEALSALRAWLRDQSKK